MICNFQSPSLLLYFYIPIFVACVFLAFFIFYSDKKSQINKNLFLFIFIFCIWNIISLLEWYAFDVSLNLFFARISTLLVFSILFFLFFAFAFVGKELKLKDKILYSIPFFPILFLTFTNYNVYMTDVLTCNTENGILSWYVYFLAIVYALWSMKIFLSSLRVEKSEDSKRQFYIIIGAVVFVVLWFIVFIELTNYLLQKKSYLADPISMLIPLGFIFFVSMLAYAITKYQFLRMKLIVAQTLTYTTWLLIGSQYFFADSMVVYLLISLTLVLSIAFGIFLIRSVKKDLERKEELQTMANKLAQANDSLRKLDNAKTEFISIASHQLRTPITAIKGFTSLILEGSYGDVSENVHGALEKIFVSSERLVNLIEDLLNVSRIESGRMTFTFEKASVEKLLKELYDNFLLIAKTKQFYLDLKMPDPALEIAYQLLAARVTIRAELKDEGVVIDEKGFVIPGQKSEFGKMVRITVSDTGIGIPQEEIPYLFKKFSRGKDVSRLHVGGTGLGLFVGKAIAEAHHGQVWVESDGAGLGSRFIIEIPLEPPKDPNNQMNVKGFIESI